jgi:hypothetical protein
MSARSWATRIVEFPLVAMAIAIVLYACAAALAYIVNRTLPAMPTNAKTPLQVAINVGLLLIAYKVVIRHLGERPRDDLPVQGSVKYFGLGFAGGGCCHTGQLVRDVFQTAILAAFAEELLFRGILFRWIEEFAGSWAALVVTAALFGLVHIENANATWFSSFAIAMEAGVLLGGVYMLTRNLWAPMGLHAAWNFTQGYIFDVPVSGGHQDGLTQAKLSGPTLLSGGPFGLEASVLALVIATAAGVWLVALAVRRGELVRPWWVQRT